MKRPLRCRFWLPLLLVFGYHYREKSCFQSTGGRCSRNANFFGLIFVDAAEKCAKNRCVPDCSCVLPELDNVTCAIDYGAWGWIPSQDSEDEEVWKNLDREYEINYGKIQPTGMRGANRVTGIGRGIGKIIEITDTTLKGEVYFEGHPDQLDENLGLCQRSMIVELYGGIEFGLEDCTSEGIMLGHRLVNMTGFNDVVSNFDYTVEEFDEYNSILNDQSIECHPRSTNGRLGKVDFTLRDPFYYNEKTSSIMNLWYPFRSNVKFGNMEFCIHIEMIDPNYESEDDDFNDDYFKKRNVTSYMDTKFKVEVSAPNAANEYTRFREELSEVKVYSNKPFGPVEGVTTSNPMRYNETVVVDTETPTAAPTMPTEIVIPVKSYQCGSPDESDIPGVYNENRTMRMGQLFRVCVEPTMAYEKAYKVIGFQNIFCENSFRNTTIIDEHGHPNLFTTIDRNTIGFTKKKGGIVTSDRTLSFSSVITGDLAGAFDGGDKHFMCRGIVYFQSTLEDDVQAMGARGQLNTPVYDASTPAPTLPLTQILADSEDSVGDTVKTQGMQKDEPLNRRRAARTTGNLRKSRSLSAPRFLQVENPTNSEDQELGQWDKIESNAENTPTLPVVGRLSVRIDLSPDPPGAVEEQVVGFVNKSVNKVKQWFFSSASRNSPRSDYFIHTFLGVSVLLPLLIFA